MNLWITAVLIGLGAGVIDIIPMIIQRLDKRATISAFLQYLFVGIIIVMTDLPGIPWWIEGSLISFALSLPVIVIVSVNDKKVIPIIGVMAVILGALISITANYLV